MVKIAIQGACGRMGHQLVQLIGDRKDCEVVAGIDTAACDHKFPVYGSLAEAKEKIDVVIDFSLPEAVKKILPDCREKQIPIVICTTGLDEQTISDINDLSRQIPVFRSANMSLGVNVLVAVAKKAAALLPGFDIEIVEKHHRNKLDAPSGTALMLADAINEQAGHKYQYQYDRHELRRVRPEDEIGIHAVRGGSIVGEHDVIFAGGNDTLTLSHSAHSRAVFANGAIAAALYLPHQAPGLYDMNDMLELV